MEEMITREQMEKLKKLQDYLRSFGATWFQGYYYSKPMPMDEYEKYLENFDLKH